MNRGGTPAVTRTVARVVARVAACRAAARGAFIALLLCAAAPQARADGPAPCLVGNAFSFGNVAVGTSASRDVTVSNCGEGSLVISGTDVAPGSSPAFAFSGTCVAGAVLGPFESCSVGADFIPAAAGQVSAGLYVRSGAANALAAFYGRGTDARAGTGTLRFVPSPAVFPPTGVGTSSAVLPVDLVNDGPGTLTPTAMVINGTDAHDFSGQQGSCVPGTPLAAGSSCTVSLRFQPREQGPRSATLLVDAPELADLASLALAGTGNSPSQPVALVVEYHHAGLDHYFMTSAQSEIGLCDAGLPPCAGWQRTGYSFSARVNSTGGAAGVCRFYNDHFASTSTHFYALQGLGCEETLSYFPDWQLETRMLFYALAPSAGGACAPGFVPVYRLYNNGEGGAPNHRFITDLAVRAQMVARGWTPEGSGTGVAFCVPG